MMLSLSQYSVAHMDVPELVFVDLLLLAQNPSIDIPSTYDAPSDSTDFASSASPRDPSIPTRYHRSAPFWPLLS